MQHSSATQCVVRNLTKFTLSHLLGITMSEKYSVIAQDIMSYYFNSTKRSADQVLMQDQYGMIGQDTGKFKVKMTAIYAHRNCGSEKHHEQ